MTNKTYRVGIVGLRGIAANPATEPPAPFGNEVKTSHVASLALLPNVDLVGYCDLVPELLDDFEENWGARWPNATRYTSHKEMLDKEGLDILGVATGDNVHAAIAVDGANAGIKGLYVEKPMATSLEDADRMLKACEDNGVAFSVDHTRRWSPLHHQARDTIRSGAIGPLRTIVATLGGGRAMTFRNGTHMIDNIVFYAESGPAKVFAQLEDGFDHWDQYRGDGGKLPENEPGASGYILFQNGVRAFYNGTKETFGEYSLQLSGAEGQIRVDETSAVMVKQDGGEKATRNLVPPHYQVHGLVAAYRELIDKIENGGDGVSSGREARKTVQIMAGFLKSHQAGSSLVDVPE